MLRDYHVDYQEMEFSRPYRVLHVKPRLHEHFLCGNCIWQFLFARVNDRQIFVF